jgi:hypothetical protein
MNPILKTKITNDRGGNERGAALISTFLISTLLMIVGGALILTTSMSAVLAVDSTAELQAYYSAEAGVNAALNVLRGNVQSNPANTAATFQNAKDNDTLAPWLDYNTTINGTSAVSLSNSPVLGYSITLTDADNLPDPKEPTRLLLQVTGYGPKGAVKRMEVMVDRYIFDYSAISTILIRGNDDNTTTMGFAVGSSGSKIYSGFDQADPSKAIPVIGVTHTNDFNLATAEVASKPGTVYGSQQVKQFSISQLPPFLQTADNARAFLNELQATAVSEGRYFPTSSGTFGTTANPQFTFIDGDCNLDGGAGLLVVTGHLELNGTPSFNGLVLVLGKGTMSRSGGGSGDILGAFAIATFARTWPVGENGQLHPFLAPSYDTSGGGDSTIAFDSNAIDSALSLAPPRVLAIREHGRP